MTQTLRGHGPFGSSTNFGGIGDRRASELLNNN